MQKFTWEDYTNSQKMNPPKGNKSHLNQSSRLVQSVSELEIQLGGCKLFPGILTLFQYLLMALLDTGSCVTDTMKMLLCIDIDGWPSHHRTQYTPRERTGHDSTHLHFKRTWAVPVCLHCLQRQPSVSGSDTDLCIYSNKTHSDSIHYREQ